MPDFTAVRVHVYVSGAVILAANHNDNETEIYTEHNNAFNASTGHTHTGTTGDGPLLNSTGLDLTASYAWTGIHSFITTQTTSVPFTLTGNSLTTANLVNLTSNSSDTSSRILLRILNDHTSATGATPLSVENDSTGYVLQVLANGVLASSRYGFYLYSNAAQVNSALAFIHQDNASSTSPVLSVRNDASASSNSIEVLNSSGSVVFSVEEDGSLVLPNVDPPTAGEININSGVKVWGQLGSGGADTNSYNVSSTATTGTGTYTITVDTDFASADWGGGAYASGGGTPTQISVANLIASGVGAINVETSVVRDHDTDQVVPTNSVVGYIAAGDQ